MRDSRTLAFNLNVEVVGDGGLCRRPRQEGGGYLKIERYRTRLRCNDSTNRGKSCILARETSEVGTVDILSIFMQ